jgi:hypothetical protein
LPPQGLGEAPGLHTVQLREVIPHSRFLRPIGRVSTLEFIELSSGLSLITARGQDNLPNPITPFERIHPVPFGENPALLRALPQLTVQSGRILPLIVRCQYHSKQNILLLSTHLYASPFMSIQHPCASPFLLMHPHLWRDILTVLKYNIACSTKTPSVI